LSACLASAEHEELKELRNGFDHRGIVGRSITVGHPDKIPTNLQALPGDWDREREFDEKLSKRLLDWLTAQLATLVGSAASFASTRLRAPLASR
jgi:hypothetical protein